MVKKRPITEEEIKCYINVNYSYIRMTSRHLKSLSIVLKKLNKCLQVDDILEVYIFGSVVRNESRPTSDLDIAIFFKKEADLSDVGYRKLLSDLQVEDYSLPESDIHFFKGALNDKDEGFLFQIIKKEGVKIW